MHCYNRLMLSFAKLLLAVLFTVISSTQIVNNHVSAETATDSSPTIKFYLPVNSDQFPNLKSKLEQALNDAQLNQISVEMANSWHTYQQAIKRGQQGIYFSAPHFSAWAIIKHDFEPLMRLSSTLNYVIAVPADASHLFEINDLAGQTICTLHAYNLDYSLINDLFVNKLAAVTPLEYWATPEIMMLESDVCAAFSVNNHTFEQVNAKSASQFIRLAQSRNYPNYGFIAHPSVDKTVLNNFMRFLRASKQLDLMQDVYQLSASSPFLIPANKSDYSLEHIHSLLPYWEKP